MPNTPDPIQARLDVIIEHIERMDKRDRARTIGGFIRSLIGLIPMVLTIYGLWYLYAHGDEFMEKVSQQAAKAAAEVAGDAAVNVVDPELMKRVLGQ